MKLKIEFGIVFAVTLLGFLIRVYKITDSPPALYVDETSIGFNAYSIVTTGRDEHGVKLPLFFEAFGEYKLPVYIYLVAAVQLILGPTDLSVRLPAVIFGTLTVTLTYFLAKEIFSRSKNYLVKEWAPAVAGLMMAVSPWHFLFSRPGFEASVAVFLFILGLTLFA